MYLPNSFNRPHAGLGSLPFVLTVMFASRLVVDTKSTTCTPDECLFPDCFCAGLSPPGDISVDQIPQMVVLTFDDAILPEFDSEVYQRIFNRGTSPSSEAAGETRSNRQRTNPNGCPIAATFYISHNGTDYDIVRRLHRDGHEMASHSVTHRLPQSYWTSASYDKWHREIVGQRDNLIKLARLDSDTEDASKSPSRRRDDQIVVGVRAPFLETGGDEQFRMMVDERFVYDSSMMTGPHQAGAVWPFTLDFVPSVEFCSNNRCPKRSAPGIWELPLNRWVGRDGRACAMVDSCDVQPISKGDALSYFWHNFGRFYRGNRAPFGIHLHPDWLLQNPDYFAAFETFVDSLLTDMHDVYFVTASQVISWMKDPQTVDKAPHFAPWMTSCRRQAVDIGDSQRRPDELRSSESADSSGVGDKAYDQYQMKDGKQSHTVDPKLISNPSPFEHQLRNNATSDSDVDDAFSPADRVPRTFSPKSDIHDGGDTRRRAEKPVEYIPTNGSFPRENDAEQDDTSTERGPISASHRRQVGLHGAALSDSAAKVPVYEEPIGQLAEPAPTAAHGNNIDHTHKTSDSTPTAAISRGRLYNDVTPGTHRNGQWPHSELVAVTETAPNTLPASSIKKSLALFLPVGEHIPINGFDDGSWNGNGNRRAGDKGQLKSGPADDNAWEEMTQREPPPPAVSISSSSSRYAADRAPTAIPTPTVASAVGKATNDARPNLPAAVMSAAPHVTSSTCVAVETSKWAATALATLLALSVGI